LHSLDKIKKLDADFVIPSHGKPFHGANERIEEIKSHHEDRLTEPLEAIRQPITVYDACGKLFKKELTIHEMLIAIAKTLAHPGHLRHSEEWRREEENGQ